MGFEISFEGIDKAIENLERTKKEIEKGTDRIAETLAKRGRDIAESLFASATYTGENDVTVTYRKADDGYVIEANGSQVLFIEFGVGKRENNNPHPLADEHGMIRGGLYTTYTAFAHDYWFYSSKKGAGQGGAAMPTIDKNGRIGGSFFTVGFEANRCMYETEKQLHEMLPQIIEEEMRK